MLGENYFAPCRHFNTEKNGLAPFMGHLFFQGGNH